MLQITFFGVRGSTPCSGSHVARYGGNTSCVVVEVDGEPPILFDVGTGARVFGARSCSGDDFEATVLLTHVHWDHILGLPFFGPMLRPSSSLHVVGPAQEEGTLGEALRRAVSPPLFPVGLDDLPATVSFQEIDPSDGSSRPFSFELGSVTVKAFPVRHIGPTLGYRIERGGGSMVYISDHQQPTDGSLDVPTAVIENCWQADVLVHDAQFSTEEFGQRAEWGHCSIDYAVEVARAAEVERLVLYHHDPSHSDAWIDEALRHARDRAGSDVEVIASAEGLQMRSGPVSD